MNEQRSFLQKNYSKRRIVFISLCDKLNEKDTENMDVIHEGENIEKINYSESAVVRHQFMNCNFKNCNFLKCDLTNTEFEDCSFTECDLTMAIIENTTFNDVLFTNCKLVGLNFGRANGFPFSANFTNCQMNYSIFFNLKMKKTIFTDCSLAEVEFNGTDLSMSVFKNCDFLNATFTKTKLDKADFRTSRNFSFDPDLNSVKRTKFSRLELAGLLAKYNLDIDFS